MSEQRRWAPIIVRIAGLPAETMDPFSSPCGQVLDVVAQLEDELRIARGLLVDRLYLAIHGAAPEKRHLLLAVKRDGYNGRRLAPHVNTPAWPFVAEAAGPICQRILELEQQLDEVKGDFEVLFESEKDRQCRRIARLVTHPAFACGLAVASPQAAREAARLRGTLDETRRKRLVTTLLRYVSRATLKLSPFSTFTAVGLAQPCDVDAPLTLQGSPWQRRSLVRVRRHILDRCTDLIVHYPPWRNKLTVTINDSAITLDDGRSLLRRPSHYRPDADGKLRYHEESLVRVRVGERLTRCVRALCAARMTYSELVASVAEEFKNEDSRAGITVQISRLIEIGFLHLLPPWSGDDAHLEKTMLRELRHLPRTAAVGNLISSLERLVFIEEHLLEAEDPALVCREMQDLIHQFLRAAAELSGLLHVDADVSNAGRDIYHDVWCVPATSGSEVLVRASQASIEKALHSVDPLVRYSRLYDHRTDFLYSLGALLREKKAGRLEVPLLEAFECAQPLWQAFMKSCVRGREAKDQWHSTWNPSSIPVLKELERCREAVIENFDSCIADGPKGRRIIPERLDDLLRSVPSRFKDSYGGACLFLQPASTDGSLWMLNRLKEGTARFASRYTPLMTDAWRDRYGKDVSRNSCFEIDGEETQLLDVHCVQGDTLNVHAPLTPKVLALPGTRLDLPPERLLKLSDLVITLTDDAGPCVRDLRGGRYLPVHLGGCYQDFLPTLVKFLCAFGPGEMAAVFPPPLSRDEDGIAVQERTTIGNVVLHRKTWRVPTMELRRALDAPYDSERFAKLYGWRRHRNIPEKVFAIERVPHPILGFRYQPQYVDFSSPVFMPILQTLGASESAFVEFAEMLPDAAGFPKDADGRTWAIELLVDSRSAGDGEAERVLHNGMLQANLAGS